MVARGDLGVELGVHRVPALQKEIIAAARRALKPAQPCSIRLAPERASPWASEFERRATSHFAWPFPDPGGSPRS